MRKQPRQSFLAACSGLKCFLVCCPNYCDWLMQKVVLQWTVLSISWPRWWGSMKTHLGVCVVLQWAGLRGLLAVLYLSFSSSMKCPEQTEQMSVFLRSCTGLNFHPQVLGGSTQANVDVWWCDISVWNWSGVIFVKKTEWMKETVDAAAAEDTDLPAGSGLSSPSQHWCENQNHEEEL